MHGYCSVQYVFEKTVLIVFLLIELFKTLDPFCFCLIILLFSREQSPTVIADWSFFSLYL